MARDRVTTRLDAAVIDELDALVEAGEAASRSQLVREAIREWLARHDTATCPDERAGEETCNRHSGRPQAVADTDPSAVGDPDREPLVADERPPWPTPRRAATDEGRR